MVGSRSHSHLGGKVRPSSCQDQITGSEATISDFCMSPPTFV